MDFERITEVIDLYMGRMYGEYTDWTPLKGRDMKFSKDIAASDPWQFKNFRCN